MMRTTSTFSGARQASTGLVGVVPTMGFLHEGHLSLLERASAECDTVVMTLYVNPLQFDEESDLHRYPRDLARDLALAETAGADIVFSPPPEEMFGTRPETVVSVPGLAAPMEGRFRPGHFDGVATVVTKLLGGLQPQRAYFGRKDAQQLAIVKRLVADLSLPIEIIGMPIVREPDGLALSSRNVFLGASDRTSALALSRSLMLAADAAEAGERDAVSLIGVAEDELAGERGVVVEYVQLASQADVSAMTRLDGPPFLAVAGRVGDVRLIDNVHFDLEGGDVSADRGVPLDAPSVLYRSAGGTVTVEGGKA